MKVLEAVTHTLSLGGEAEGSGTTEDRVSADPPPDDVRLPGLDFTAVLKGRAAVIGPGHLPYPWMPLDPLHAKPGMEALFVFGEMAMN